MMKFTTQESHAEFHHTFSSAEPGVTEEIRESTRSGVGKYLLSSSLAATSSNNGSGVTKWMKLLTVCVLFGAAASNPAAPLIIGKIGQEVMRELPTIGKFLGDAIKSRDFCFDQVWTKHAKRGICTTCSKTCACPSKTSQQCGSVNGLRLCCERDSKDEYCMKQNTGTTTCHIGLFGHCYTLSSSEWQEEGATCITTTAGCWTKAPCNCYRGKRNALNLYCTPKPGKDCEAWEDYQPNEVAGAKGSGCSKNSDCTSLCCSCHFKKCASYLSVGHCCWHGSCDGKCPASKTLW